MLRWFMIALLIFFVSSHGASSQDTSTDNQYIKIASWNIRILSNSRSDDELLAICKIAKQFDFIAIVELRDEAVLQRIVAMLEKEFNRSYAYELSPGVGSSDRSTELYAFLYDKTFVTPVQHGQIFQDSTFLRCPYYATFKAGNFDFTVIVEHIIWGSTVSGRRKEINRLAYVYETIQNQNLQENDVILLGDFNRGPEDDLAWGPVKAISGMIHFFDPPQKSMIWDTELYDNFWFQNTYVKEFTLDRGIIRFDETDFGNDDDAASLAVSDHRPIWGLFRIQDPDDD